MKKLSLTLITITLLVVLAGCKDSQPSITTTTEDVVIDENIKYAEVGDTIINGDFETGDLRGWTIVGQAFSSFGVTTDETYWAEQYQFNQNGDWHYYGHYGGAEHATGQLNSTPFRISTTGKITFLMGAAKDPSNCYVSLVDAITDEELVRITNDHFSDPGNANNYYQYEINIDQYVDRVVYISVVDNDSDGDFGYINVDHFQIQYN